MVILSGSIVITAEEIAMLHHSLGVVVHSDDETLYYLILLE